MASGGFALASCGVRLSRARAFRHPGYDRYNHGERNQTTASLYIQRRGVGNGAGNRLPAPQVMAHSMRQSGHHLPGYSPLAAEAPRLVRCRYCRPRSSVGRDPLHRRSDCCSSSPPLRPSSRSSVRVCQARARRSANPAESSAYSAAIGQPDPGRQGLGHPAIPHPISRTVRCGSPPSRR